MLSILNNVASTAAQNQMSITNANMQKTLEQLSSGQRINSGADDAAGLSIADGLNANVAALNQSSQNATTGVGLLQVADGALAQVTSLLNRAVTLATEAANSGLTADQHTALNNEFTSIKTEIDNIGQTTTYNGSAIFGGGAGSGSTQATDPNTLVSSAIDATAADTNTETASGKLVVDVGGKQLTFTPTTNETVGNFVNDINSQSTANGYGIQASVNSTGQLILTDTLDRGSIALDKTNTFQATVNAGDAATPTFANQGLNNLNVQEGAAGLSASTVVNPLTTGGAAITNAFTTTGAEGQFGGAVSATAASGVLTLSAVPTAASAVKIGNTTYTFQTAAISAAGEVQIGASTTATLQNLANAINGTDNFNTANAEVTAGTAATDALTIAAKTAGLTAAATVVTNTDSTFAAASNLGWKTGNVFDVGAGNVATDPTAATASFTLNDAANLASGSTVTIGDKTYIFGTNNATGNQVQVALGSSTAATVLNLRDAITTNSGNVTATIDLNNSDKLDLAQKASTITMAPDDAATGNALAATGSLTSATVAGAMENLQITTNGKMNSFQVAAGATLGDVIQTINNQGTGITASQDVATGKLVLTDAQDNGDITVSDNAGGALVNNLSGETLGGTANGDGTFTQTNGFQNTKLMTSSNTMSVFLSDSTQTGTSTVNVALNTFNSANLGRAGTGIANNDLTTTTDAATALTAINAAISSVSALRGNLGAGVNQLQAATNVMSSQTQNLTTASSNITSADVSKTVADMTKFSILSQTGMAAMAQANQMQKGILTLLQG